MVPSATPGSPVRHRGPTCECCSALPQTELTNENTLLLISANALTVQKGNPQFSREKLRVCCREKPQSC